MCAANRGFAGLRSAGRIWKVLVEIAIVGHLRLGKQPLVSLNIRGVAAHQLLSPDLAEQPQTSGRLALVRVFCGRPQGDLSSCRRNWKPVVKAPFQHLALFQRLVPLADPAQRACDPGQHGAKRNHREQQRPQTKGEPAAGRSRHGSIVAWAAWSREPQGNIRKKLPTTAEPTSAACSCHRAG
jgi:hypothetical protein